MSKENYQKHLAVKNAVIATINQETKDLLSKQFYTSAKISYKRIVISVTKDRGFDELAEQFARTLS